MKKVLLGLAFLCFFSGCEEVDSFREKIEDIKKVTQTVQELQQNIEATKKDLDDKLQQIEEAQSALSKVFGTTSDTSEVVELKKQAFELQKRLDLLEQKNTNHLEDTSEFSIE